METIQVKQQQIRSLIQNFQWETDPKWAVKWSNIENEIKNYWKNYLKR